MIYVMRGTVGIYLQVIAKSAFNEDEVAIGTQAKDKRAVAQKV